MGIDVSCRDPFDLDSYVSTNVSSDRDESAMTMSLRKAISRRMTTTTEKVIHSGL
jgi:hypothetical protein